MKCACFVLLLLMFFSGTWRLSRATCVLESDFGFILNCAFKKSGLFRVRNLGGIKAHIGLGFSVGDELGFKESISNTEMNRRRSAQASRFQTALIQAQQQQANANALKVRSPIQPDGTVSASVQVPANSAQLKQNIASTVPPFKPIPPAPERPTLTIVNATKVKSNVNIPTPAFVGVAVPQSPPSISRLSNGPTVPVYSSKQNVMGLMVPVSKNQITDKMSSNNFALRTLGGSNNDLPPPIPQTNSNSILSPTNISDDVFDGELSSKQKNIATSTTHRPPPLSHKYSSSYGKVMNAPKEYYPVGYDKNFDDNFASRVELPETSFYCGDQKHFPGLYADEDLGCMVFHVCALTDDGLIMKSFLCPESTLFDQTILKCNWWFYVDCKNSKKLYDSNIPISKSYQLMKALTFFSSYKNDAQQTSKDKD